ncbi:MAG: DUF2804 domain-containing protein [Oscillospiraceae bacterium]|jgi:hypothetical protein|nr:DUF2804 domain-containing protein [Oscillospiraceae bacterium]
MEHEITSPQLLLNAQGNIAEPGYAKRLLWEYNREQIATSALRIKEWDYYYVGNQEIGFAFTLSDVGFLGLAGVSIIDFRNQKTYDTTDIAFFPLGKWRLPRTSELGDTVTHTPKTKLSVTNDGKQRHISCIVPNYAKSGQPFTAEITLSDTPEESMVIATPFAKAGHFYYNQKINCMRCSGKAVWGEKRWELDPAVTFATLDWGRGVWTYENTWLWSSLNAQLPDGTAFGWNLGYGFGDTSAASENMLIHNGKAQKLGECVFEIPALNGKAPRHRKLGMDDEQDYFGDWHFSDREGRLDMVFHPVHDNLQYTNLGVACLEGHQVFGEFSGTAVLEDGTAVTLDKAMGFAERIHNRW